MGEKLGKKVGEKTGEKMGESLGEIHKLKLCHYFEENIAEKYQKQQFVSSLRQILRPKPAMLPNF